MTEAAATSNADDRIPVTVVTGFLGAGKTTFVNYLRKEMHGKRLAIIENEFGEVGVDDGLLQVKTSEEVIEMMNGCICCTVRDDLIQALQRLARDHRKQFDAIVIETTGLADPAPVAQTFFVDDNIKALFVLDAVITFVDCKHVTAHLDEVKPAGVENEAIEQVAFADVLVLNKTDLVTPEELGGVRARLRAINSSAKVVESTQSRVPVDEVFNIRAFDLDRTLVMDSAFLEVNAEHLHDNSVSSVGISIEGDVLPGPFEAWLMELLRTRGADIFRSKGIISMCGSDERWVFQGVHMLLRMGSSGDLGLDLPGWAPGEKRMNKLCFIGRNLNRTELQESLKKCILDSGKLPEPGTPPKTKPRFPVGTRVLVNLGTWEEAEIVAHWYREPYWETGRFAPYQFRVISDGGLCYAPKDSDKFVKKC